MNERQAQLQLLDRVRVEGTVTRLSGSESFPVDIPGTVIGFGETLSQGVYLELDMPPVAGVPQRVSAPWEILQPLPILL